MRTVRFLATLILIGVFAVPPAHAANDDELMTMQRFIDLMQGYYSIIGAIHDVTANSEKSAILQMQKIKEVYDERGETARAASVFRDVLDSSTNPAIRGAAVLLLSETLKESGRSDEAVKVLIEGLDENVTRAEAGD
ncbi:MAG: hypothetical protein AAFO81_10475 [Pseudomonadota bacterium]